MNTLRVAQCLLTSHIPGHTHFPRPIHAICCSDIVLGKSKWGRVRRELRGSVRSGAAAASARRVEMAWSWYCSSVSRYVALVEEREKEREGQLVPWSSCLECYVLRHRISRWRPD